jgi:hypothetical protein
MIIQLQLNAKDSAVLERMAVALETIAKNTAPIEGIAKTLETTLPELVKNTAAPPVVGIGDTLGTPTQH